MLGQLGVSVGFQFILMDIIKHLVCSLANNYTIADFSNLVYNNIFYRIVSLQQLVLLPP